MRFIDLFCGVGGFRIAMERAGHECVWSSDIDRWCEYVHRKRFGKGFDNRDIREARVEDIPDCDCICGGFPCQDLSIAGKRAGLEGKRSGLFYEVVRLAEAKKPRYLFLENVKGLLSSDKGWDFARILIALDEIGYDVEWAVVNSKDVIPQNRERVFIVGHLRGQSRREVFPIGESNERTNPSCEGKELLQETANALKRRDYKDGTNFVLEQIGELGSNSMGQRVYSTNGISTSIRSQGGGQGAKTGLYVVGNIQKTITKRAFDTPVEINEFMKQHKGELTISQIAEKLGIPKTQAEHYFRTDDCRAVPNKETWLKLKELLKFGDSFDEKVCTTLQKLDEFEMNQRVYSAEGVARTLTDSKETGLYCVPVLTPDRPNKRQNGRRFKENGEPSFTLTKQDIHGVCIKKHRADEIRNHGQISPTLTESHEHYGGANPPMWATETKIRRLTPTECERLQTFPDNWTQKGIDEKGNEILISDTQRYKMMGNAVTTEVVYQIARRLE